MHITVTNMFGRASTSMYEPMNHFLLIDRVPTVASQTEMASMR